MVINKVPKEIRPKVKVFLNAVDDYFSFLRDYGYKFKEAKIATEYVVDNIIEVFYENTKLNRRLRIHYEPNDLDKNTVDLISLTFYKVKKNSNDELDFDMYIEKYNPEIDTDILAYPEKNNKDSFKENMETSVSGYAYFLKDIGINIVNGTEWEDGLHFDWSSAEKILYQAQKDIIYEDKKDDDNDDDT